MDKFLHVQRPNTDNMDAINNALRIYFFSFSTTYAEYVRINCTGKYDVDHANNNNKKLVPAEGNLRYK